MIRVLAIFGAIAGFLLTTSSWAQDADGTADIFTVARVPVEATAASAEEARLIAQDRGRSRALQILLQRLTPSEDWPYLPRPRLSELLDMQVGFEVDNERFSTQSGSENLYLANITYSFRRDRIRPLLRTEGIPFSESQAAPALVLAVFDHGDTRLLWEGNNPWAASWHRADLTHELVPMTMPRGDLADLTTVPVDDVVAGNWQGLQFLANRYNVSRVLVAHGVLLETANGSTLYARLTEITENGVGEVHDTQVTGAPVIDDLSGNVDLGDMGTRAITILTGRFQERWKAQTLVSYDVMHRLEATVQFEGLDDWVHIREAFEDSATVTEYDAHALSARGAEVAVTFVGTTEQLMITLDQRGVALSGDQGYWSISMRGSEFGRLSNAGGTGTAAVSSNDRASGVFDPSGKDAMSLSQGARPPVETIVVRENASPNAPVLTGDDLNILFETQLTPEEVEERRRQGLGDQPGTMQPVGN